MPLTIALVTVENALTIDFGNIGHNFFLFQWIRPHSHTAGGCAGTQAAYVAASFPESQSGN